MEITVFVKELIPVQSGVSSSGKAWQKCGFVGETGGEYSKEIAFTLFGEKNVAKCPQVGQQVNVAFDISSRKSPKGGWFHDINAFQVTPVGQSAIQQQQYAPQQQPYNNGWGAQGYPQQGNQVVYPNQSAPVMQGQPQWHQQQSPQQFQRTEETPPF